MSMGALLRAWLPPAVADGARQLTGRSLTFTGDWPDWASARAASRGYDDAAILQKVVQATRAVERGDAAFERDSTLFAHWEPPFQLLAPLLRHALRHDGTLDVVDFGGALGSTWRQCRPFLPTLRALAWRVVEQPAFVAAGRQEFGGDVLGFFDSIEQLPPPLSPRLLLASSVLQYLPEPHRHMAAWAARTDVATVVIDRTPVSDASGDRLCIQQAPRAVYDGSYPCWILSRARLLDAFPPPRWRLVCDFDCPEGWRRVRGGPPFEFKGFVFERTVR
jgi:putative methyltransferase (TIGR04325 family)